MRELKRTPLWETHLSLGAKMTEFGGYQMPLQYKGVIAEHNAVRNEAGVFDVSHMARFRLRGKKVAEFLDWLLPNRIAKLKPGRATYSPMCDQNGGIIDDLVVYSVKRGDEEEFIIVGNAANHEVDLQWITEKAEERSSGEITVEDITEEVAQIALQGPKSQSYLEKILGSLPELYFYQFYSLGDVIISRTGYTGEDGFEIYGSPDRISRLFNDLIELGVQPCGLGARDTLRLEAGYPLYGNELSRDVTPFEAGIGWTVKKDKDFIGKDAVLKPPRWKTIGLKAPDKRGGIARKGYKVLLENEEVGVITSGTLSPTLGVPIAIARVKSDLEADRYDVQIRGRLARFEETPLPFVPHRVKRKPKRTLKKN